MRISHDDNFEVHLDQLMPSRNEGIDKGKGVSLLVSITIRQRN